MLEDLIKEINDSKIFDFIVDESNLLDVMDSYNSMKNCKNCKSLIDCKNPSNGFSVTLNGLKKCKYRIEYENEIKKSESLEGLFFSKKSLEANISDFDLTNESRIRVLKAIRFIFDNDEKIGLFISGGNNAGKTFLLSSIANMYKEKGKTIIISFVPDLIRNLRTIRFSNEIEKIINQMKTVDILMLDDLGIEITDLWFSTEILTPILNYRLQEKLNTFFSSNYTLNELAERIPKDNIKEHLRLIRRIFSLVLKNGEKRYFEIEKR